MNAKKSKQKRSKAKRLAHYLAEYDYNEMKKWAAAEPPKILFIHHYLWKRKMPKLSNYTDRQLKKAIK